MIKKNSIKHRDIFKIKFFSDFFYRIYPILFFLILIVSGAFISKNTRIYFQIQKENKTLISLYCQVISDYIKHINTEYSLVPDTLYIGKNNFGNPEDFPDIDLPKKIHSIPVKLIRPEEWPVYSKYAIKGIYITLVAWVTQEKANFVLIAFKKNFEHYFDAYMNYRYSNIIKKYQLTNKRFQFYSP